MLIPGDMGRYSYVLVGTQGAFDETFGSTCHGAGRVLSRHAAKKESRAAQDIEGLLADRGILVRAASRATVAEEISEAYKDVMEVVQVVQQAGIGRIVARLRPMAVVKGLDIVGASLVGVRRWADTGPGQARGLPLRVATEGFMKVFLTGGTGFVGSEVLGQLLSAGHTVRCLVRAGLGGETADPGGGRGAARRRGRTASP